jgi:hypothetical protein
MVIFTTPFLWLGGPAGAGNLECASLLALQVQKCFCLLA